MASLLQISQEYKLLFDNDEDKNFFGRFPTFYAPRILKYCEI